ncbi:cation:proton antiporter [Paenibacillus sp. GCM10023252]|uniref:cation:proton antiporter n=1 Tax=Paenibacillus sp. GCM10023252 TaxID=3252649 RepID=UPI0036151685
MVTEATPVIHHMVLLFLLVLCFGMLSGRIAAWLRLPDVALFIVMGMVLGQGLHLINEGSASVVNQLVLTVGSVLILFDGGRNISLRGLQKVKWTISLLSVPGVLITIAVTGAAIHYLFGIEWLYALLAGSVIASTDPASIIPVFRQVTIRKKVRETVESESAFNDATGSIITFALLAAVTGESALEAGPLLWEFVRTAAGGILLGAAVGVLIVLLAVHPKLGILKEYTTIAMVVTALGAYLLGDYIHVSGFMATFVAGLVWGNPAIVKLNLEAREQELVHFSDNMTVIMRMLIFVLLGSQADLALMLEYGLQSLAVVLLFMFVARPLTVLASALPDRAAKWTGRELLFMMWVRETGVIPAALSGIIIGMGVKHADIIASITLMAILMTILVQASTTAWVAKRLGMDAEA